MKTVCAWCKKVMKDNSFEIHPEELVSHGICKECIAVVFGPQRLSIIDYLDSLDAPVLLIDAVGNAECANSQAMGILQKEMPEIAGRKGGDVFECAFAKLPQGCGNTTHCDACTIRNTVMDTMLSGNSHLRTPAYLIRGLPGDNQEVKFLISTEKVADVVLLRIDTVGEH